MRDDRDFAMNAEDPKPADDSTASSPASPMVVIEYRRGLSAVLAPPVLILLATLVILSYQRQTPIRPIATARPTADSTPKDPAGRGRIIMVESSGAGAAFEPIAARAETRFGPPAPPASPPAPAPLAVASLTPAPTAPVAEAPKPVGEAEADGAPSPFDLDRPNDQPPPPAPERAIEGEPVPHGGRGDGLQAPPAPRRGAFVVEPPPPPPPAPEPVAAPVHPEAPTAVARAEPEVPRPTKEQILDDIRREAEQKKAEQKQMDLLKLQARGLQLYETYQKAQASRVPFR
ncbi:MAG: hypothetical protein ACM35G_12830, partial [Planctomycetaceae bacterium]